MSIGGKLIAVGVSAAAFTASSVGGMELFTSAAKALGTHIFAEVMSKLGEKPIERSRARGLQALGFCQSKTQFQE